MWSESGPLKCIPFITFSTSLLAQFEVVDLCLVTRKASGSSAAVCAAFRSMDEANSTDEFGRSCRW